MAGLMLRNHGFRCCSHILKIKLKSISTGIKFHLIIGTVTGNKKLSRMI